MLFKNYNKSILILFAILILCSGKLLKDYLYKNQFIEGLSASSTSNDISRSNSGPKTVSLTFHIITGVSIPNDGTGKINISWIATELSAAGVTFPSFDINKFTAAAPTPSGLTLISSIDSGATDIKFTVGGAAIPANSKITITISDVTISTDSPPLKPASNINFTITSSAGESAVAKILVKPSTGVLGISGSSSTSDIETAITNLNTAINAEQPGSPRRQTLLDAKSVLIKLLADSYGTVAGAGAYFTSGDLYNAQKTALDFIGKEKARATQNMTIIESDNTNKKRMSQINQYYTQNYQANITILKYVIYMSIALIIITILKTKEYIPPSISTLGTICILAFGSIEIGKRIYDILRRNDFEFDKYDWSFDQSKMDSAKIAQANTNPTDLSALGSIGAPCYGPGCCDAGTSWSDTAKKCTPGATLTGTAEWNLASPPAASTLTVNITNTIAIPANGTIKFTPPSGLFTTYGQTTPSNGSWALGVFTYTAPSQINANTTTPITFTGAALASLLPDADRLPRVIRDVYSSSEPNRTTIKITGIPAY